MPRDLDAATVTRLNLREQILASFPDLTEDAQALQDTLAGIDDFEEVCLAALRYAVEREAHGKALGEMIDGMKARKGRLEEGAKNLRNQVMQAMQEAGLSRIKAPDMSVSVGPGKPKLIITDEAAVPAGLCRIKREPDKKLIAEWLVNRAKPDWVEWGNPVPFLSLRRT